MSGEIERTDVGDQHLITGVKPLTMRDRLQRRADAPLAPGRAQRPCDVGLFDDVARRQLDFFSQPNERTNHDNK